MNDEEIKSLLRQDKSMPLASPYEWSKIERKINENSKSEESYSWGLTSIFKVSLSLCSALLCFFLINNYQSYESSKISDKELVEYMFEDNYFDSANEPIYAWID